MRTKSFNLLLHIALGVEFKHSVDIYNRQCA